MKGEKMLIKSTNKVETIETIDGVFDLNDIHKLLNCETVEYINLLNIEGGKRGRFLFYNPFALRDMRNFNVLATCQKMRGRFPTYDFVALSALAKTDRLKFIMNHGEKCIYGDALVLVWKAYVKERKKE